MKYTKYFGLISRDRGQLHLPPGEFQRMMNIVHLEGVLYGLNLAKERYKNSNLYYQYDTVISRYDAQLMSLTQSQTPELLLRDMVQAALGS